MNPPVSSPAIKVVKSVREQVSAEEWQARVDLAACYRLTAMYGMTELIANHISCRVPGHNDQFLINPYGMLYEEIDASCLIKVDVEGNTLFNASDYNVNLAGFVIHSAIHMAKHDAGCVAHTHTPAGMAVSAMECGLLPLAHRPRCGSCASATTILKASPTMSTSARGWSATSAITRP
jgi:ribulose-5-phosphate 4-epimerase/fuculose-1-phosphate aldolase